MSEPRTTPPSARTIDWEDPSDEGPGSVYAAGFLVQGDRPGDHRFSHALVRSAVAL
jgi:hypothetical protein